MHISVESHITYWILFLITWCGWVSVFGNCALLYFILPSWLIYVQDAWIRKLVESVACKHLWNHFSLTLKIKNCSWWSAKTHFGKLKRDTHTHTHFYEFWNMHLISLTSLLFCEQLGSFHRGLKWSKFFLFPQRNYSAKCCNRVQHQGIFVDKRIHEVEQT